MTGEKPTEELEDKNRRVEDELKRIFEGVQFTPDGEGDLSRTLKGRIDDGKGEIEEVVVSDIRPHWRLISLTVTKPPKVDELAMTNYIYPMWTGELTRSTFNAPIVSILREVDPSDFTTPEAYRRALYEHIGRRKTQYREGLEQEGEMGLHQGTGDDWSEFVGSLEKFTPGES